jgi:hypothetical protein
MRRRQKELNSMTEPDIKPIDQEDPEANLETEDEEGRHPLMAAFELSSHTDGERKSPSIFPRNYNTRRRLLIAGGCFILGLIFFSQASNDGKVIKSSLILVICCIFCNFLWNSCMRAINSSFFYTLFRAMMTLSPRQSLNAIVKYQI